jgi:rare lipoprotein A
MPQTTDHPATQLHKNVNAPYNRPYTVRGQTYHPIRTAVGYRETGIASWYGSESGNRTAKGTHFNPQGLTAAHKTLPLPTKVKVTNLRNGRSVNVVVNDRGPFKKNRLIDLSYGAAKKIGLDKQGLTKVKVEYLDTLASN